MMWMLFEPTSIAAMRNSCPAPARPPLAAPLDPLAALFSMSVVRDIVGIEYYIGILRIDLRHSHAFIGAAARSEDGLPDLHGVRFAVSGCGFGCRSGLGRRIQCSRRVRRSEHRQHLSPNRRPLR